MLKPSCALVFVLRWHFPTFLNFRRCLLQYVMADVSCWICANVLISTCERTCFLSVPKEFTVSYERPELSTLPLSCFEWRNSCSEPEPRTQVLLSVSTALGASSLSSVSSFIRFICSASQNLALPLTLSVLCFGFGLTFLISHSRVVVSLLQLL